MNNNYGFNTFVTKDWLPLAEVLVESILAFSHYPITVNCINFEHDFKNQRVNSKTIYLEHINFYAVCMTKWLSLLENPYNICAMLDADMIATKEVDNLFYDNEIKIVTSEYPLMSKHPHNPFTNPIHQARIQDLCETFSKNTPKMNWVYACGLVTPKHKNFIQELIEAISSFYERGIDSYIEDEGVLNALLVKYQVSQDLGYNHIPNSTLINAYLRNNMNDQELVSTYTIYECPVRFYLLHGCKNPTLAKSILDQIYELHI